MRVNPDLYTSVNMSLQQSEQSLQTAMNQLSSGKRVSLPSDDPLAFAQNVESLASSANIDTYTKNADAVTAQAQLADSALSSVVTSLTKALSLGTEGGDGTLTAQQRSALANQVQGLVSQIAAQANVTSNGVALFAGTSGVTTPFSVDPGVGSGYSYAGNSDSNQTAVGDNFSVPTSMSGDQIFLSSDGSVFGSLQQMITALQSGSDADLSTATTAVSAAISHIGRVRVFYGNTVSQLAAQNDYLSQETISLSSQQTSLVGIDTATAATNLTQAQTAQSAVLAMAAKILPTSLLNYLQN